MSAAEMRKAAETLRERAGAASPAPWRPFEQHGRDYTDEGWSEIGAQNDGHTVALTYPTGFENDYPGPDAAYIATMHPGVGLALADWLEATASEHEGQPSGNPTVDAFFASLDTAPDRAALLLAQLINGGAS